MAIALIMKLTNTISDHVSNHSKSLSSSLTELSVVHRALCSIVTLLHPLAPFFAAEGWATLSSLHAEGLRVVVPSWPVLSSVVPISQTVTVNVCVMGKRRKVLEVPIAQATDEETLSALAVAV